MPIAHGLLTLTLVSDRLRPTKGTNMLYRCYVEATCSDFIEVEADTEYEAESLAQDQVDDLMLPYSVGGGYTFSWDNVEVTSVEPA